MFYILCHSGLVSLRPLYPFSHEFAIHAITSFSPYSQVAERTTSPRGIFAGIFGNRKLSRLAVCLVRIAQIIGCHCFDYAV